MFMMLLLLEHVLLTYYYVFILDTYAVDGFLIVYVYEVNGRT